MACIIHIETATQAGSLAVSNDGTLVFEKCTTEALSHAASMGVFAEEAIQLLNKKNMKPDAVAVSEGPGSYTGLRIGVSLAKGLCYGLDIPLIALPTLQVMTVKLMTAKWAAKWYCPMIDARRMEVYSAVYDADFRLIRPVEANIIDAFSFGDYLSEGKTVFFGNGSDKCKTVIDSPNAVFVDGIYPSASSMVVLAENAYSKKEFVDVAYFEPFYLKEFQATIPRNKVF